MLTLVHGVSPPAQVGTPTSRSNRLQVLFVNLYEIYEMSQLPRGKVGQIELDHGRRCVESNLQQSATYGFEVTAICFGLAAQYVLAQNLGQNLQFNVAVQGQTGSQPEGALLNFINRTGNVIAPVGAGGAVPWTQWVSWPVRVTERFCRPCCPLLGLTDSSTGVPTVTGRLRSKWMALPPESSKVLATIAPYQSALS
jgi:hypothetical protein